MKKIMLLIAIVGLMSAGLLMGCKKQSETPPPAPTPAPAAPSTNAPAATNAPAQ